MFRLARASILSRSGLGLNASRVRYNSSGSLFNEVTKVPTTPEPVQSSTPEKITSPEQDTRLQEYLNPEPFLATKSLVSPLKSQLFNENVKKNGFFINDEIMKLGDESYKLHLTRDEIQALEPSVYLRSWRIKSSVKKTNIVLRALKDMPLKKAITQLHFLQKKVARPLAEMLERGVEDAKKMGYDPNKLYISESWVHTDGQWVKRPDFKGRGRSGIFLHRYVSVRFLLKSEQTQKRLAYESEQRLLRKPVWNNLTKTKIIAGSGHKTVKPIPVVMEPSGYLTKMLRKSGGSDYLPPADSVVPTLQSETRFYLYKFDEKTPEGQKIALINDKSYYRVGKDRKTNDIVLDDELVSSSHAVIQFRKINSRIVAYIMDLGSTNGTFLQDQELPPNKYVELRHKDAIQFGDPESEVEFVFIQD
ncbi:hypothetical protein OGAPHI_007289 [Ogataea philodendri]|uniref:FHA domain-containing protein n=1 Tax=Ogataea philodendri TaxID=1378263 RepID=A0A9P8NVA8_9ASCO|nr:uncharacterized protein OGAPHI_007289 [Ogataea philodendri]KAH3660084.1 hypothetical protein OGAPHI_007289 [Ogataea philodendri]